ncbi:hypothetical protein CL652_03145 [bacterium]|nr:hypothetical protein [bacterium]|tara:strand:- start:558 stop:1016 length:459 start_codon:yes stop_codon:yes gene_type:complete
MTDIEHRLTLIQSLLWGTLGASLLFGIYVLVLTLVSGQEYMLDQLATFWFFIVSLALGFGTQVGLYIYLRKRVHNKQAGGSVVAVSGTTSTAAMISCCAHYLINILPVLGTAGLVTLIAQYQISLFWVGLVANALGILYIASKIVAFNKHHE